MGRNGQSGLAEGAGQYGIVEGAGRLEIYYRQERPFPLSAWGTVCSNGFNEHEADVACQQLGFLYAVRVNTVVLLGCVYT